MKPIEKLFWRNPIAWIVIVVFGLGVLGSVIYNQFYGIPISLFFIVLAIVKIWFDKLKPEGKE